MTGIVSTLHEVSVWLSTHRVDLLLSGAVAAVLSAALGLWLASRHDRIPDVATWVSVAIATAFSAEGMWEVAREGLHMSRWQAIGLFAVAEAAMTSEAIRARRRVRSSQHPGAHAHAVWVIAACAGAIAALNAAVNHGNIVEVPVRLGVPLLAAWLWWRELTSTNTRPPDAITWRLTWRRIAVWAGLAEPGSRDVTEVDRARRIAALTTTAHRLHHGSKRLRRLRTAKLRRLALDADDAMVAEAAQRLDRVHRIESLIAPRATADTTSTPPVSGHHPGDTPDSGLDKHPAPVRRRDRTPVLSHGRTHRRTSGRGKAADTAAEIVRLYRAHPDMTQEQIARRVGVSDRTVRRHLAAALNGKAISSEQVTSSEGEN